MKRVGMHGPLNWCKGWWLTRGVLCYTTLLANEMVAVLISLQNSRNFPGLEGFCPTAIAAQSLASVDSLICGITN